MKKIILFLLAAILATTHALADTKVALVIGNSAYPTSPLTNPVNDATDMSAALQELGFTTTLLTDATQREMDTAIKKFGQQLFNAETGLFYFAGHGMQINGQNYLIPVDANVASESDVKYESVNAGRVLDKMNEAGNKVNIVLLDACRDNPFARSFRSGRKGLARMDAPPGSIIGYATAPGQTASDGIGRNGVYTKALLNNIAKPGADINQMFMAARIEVAKLTGNKQIPWESSSLMDYFYFNSKGNNLKAQAKTLAPIQTASLPPAAKTRAKTTDLRNISFPYTDRFTNFDHVMWDEKGENVNLNFGPEGLILKTPRGEESTGGIKSNFNFRGDFDIEVGIKFLFAPSPKMMQSCVIKLSKGKQHSLVFLIQKAYRKPFIRIGEKKRSEKRKIYNTRASRQGFEGALRITRLDDEITFSLKPAGAADWKELATTPAASEELDLSFILDNYDWVKKNTQFPLQAEIKYLTIHSAAKLVEK
ncbi:caspase family protein [Maridesulfovibrio sp.]|uniref:caspase family protein n=1 Tax=Maridesulfovibrio sp. TaxID=2795000 RepID=UPI0039F01C8A